MELNKKQKDENYNNNDDDESKNKDKSYLQQQSYLVKQRQRYRRSLSAKSFEHLITKKGSVKENEEEDDDIDEGVMGSTNKKDLTNAQTFNDNNGNMMTTTVAETKNVENEETPEEDDGEEEEEEVVLIAKSNYNNKFMKEQYYTTTTNIPSIFITSSSAATTSDELLSSSLSSSLSSYNLKDDDKTLKINNILNLNQSNQHYINKEQSINVNIPKQKYQNQKEKEEEEESKKNLNITKQDKVDDVDDGDDVDDENINAKSLSKVLHSIIDENLIMTSSSTLQPKIFKDKEEKGEDETTTTQFTIFENYNYDEEIQNLEDLYIEPQVPINKNKQIPKSTTEHDKNSPGNSINKVSSPKGLISDGNNHYNSNDNNEDDIVMTNVENGNSIKKLSSLKALTNDNNKDDKFMGNEKNFDFETEPSAAGLGYDNVDNIVTKNDNNSQINRFNKDSNNDSMTFNSHHLFDNYDDVYLTQNTSPKQEEDEKEEKEKSFYNEKNLLLNDTLKEFPPTSILATSKSKPDIVVKHEGNNNEDADDVKDDSLDNLMLNDGLLPLNSHNGFVEMNYAQNLDDIDIVKLEQTHSTEDELYKTINETKDKPKEKSKKYKFKLNTTNYDKQKNEVISSEEKEDKENNNITPELQVVYESPITSAPKLSPQMVTSAPTYKSTVLPNDLAEKRIIVNLTIASNDGTGNMYTLHVNIPAFDQTNQVQNMQQILTHEKLPQQQNEDQKSVKPEIQNEKIKNQAENLADNYNSSPYCIPEPPPPIPECPCACNIYTSTQIASSSESDFDNDFDLLTSTSNPTSVTTTPISNIPANNDRIDNNIDDFDNLFVSDDFETTTTNLLEDVNVVTDNLPTNIVMNSNKNGEKFACPDVMPVLILEGDLC